MSRYRKLGLTALALAFLIAMGLALRATEMAGVRSGANGKAISLRLPWLINAQAAGYIMAREKGFYRQVGLDVDILPGGPNLNSAALVASGANTFGTNDIGNIILGVSQGMDLRIIGACFQRYPVGVISLAKSQIHTPQDLVGRTLAYNEGGPWTFIKAMLAKQKVSLSKIHLVVSPSTELLINGSVDARTGFTVNQQLALERMGYSTSAILPSDYGVNSYAEAIFTRPQILKSDPDLVRRFVAATVRGYDYAYSHQQETVGALMLANPQLDPAQQAAQLKHQAAYIYTEFSRAHGTCAFQPSVISQTQDILTQFGGLKRRVDIQNIYSTDYLPSKKGQ